MVIMWLIVLPLLLVLLLLLLPLRLLFLLLLLLLLLGLTICFFPISTSIQSIQSIFWSILRSSDLRRKSESIIGIICICQESEIVPWTKDQHPKHGYVVTKRKMNPYGYGSTPIDTLDTFLVGWTSIYQLFWGSLGTRVLTHPHIRSIWRTDISGYLNLYQWFRDPDNWAPQLQSRMVTWDADKKRSRRLSETGDPEKDYVFSWKCLEMYRNVMSRTWLLSICSKHPFGRWRFWKQWYWFRW